MPPLKSALPRPKYCARSSRSRGTALKYAAKRSRSTEPFVFIGHRLSHCDSTCGCSLSGRRVEVKLVPAPSSPCSRSPALNLSNKLSTRAPRHDHRQSRVDEQLLHQSCTGRLGYLMPGGRFYFDTQRDRNRSIFVTWVSTSGSPQSLSSRQQSAWFS